MNVPLDSTIVIILNRIYNKKELTKNIECKEYERPYSFVYKKCTFYFQ